jgi:hypothetical protein
VEGLAAQSTAQAATRLTPSPGYFFPAVAVAVAAHQQVGTQLLQPAKHRRYSCLLVLAAQRERQAIQGKVV